MKYTQAEQVRMEKTLIESLVESLKEAAEISKGTRKPSRRFVVPPLKIKAAGEASA
jgi:preprotein translocase subunit Sss1